MSPPANYMMLLVPEGMGEAARESAFVEAEKRLARRLPEDYRNFLTISNGYNDEVGNGYLVLWPIEELFSANDGYETARMLPDALLIGSNGAGVAYGVDWADGAPVFISVPFMPMQRCEVRVLGRSFGAFVASIARGEGW